MGLRPQSGHGPFGHHTEHVLERAVLIQMQIILIAMQLIMTEVVQFLDVLMKMQIIIIQLPIMMTTVAQFQILRPEQIHT